MEKLFAFSSCSANDGPHQYLWIVGASLFIPQMNRLLKHTNYDFTIEQITDFATDNDFTNLGDIFAKNHSDKSTNHNYHIMYSHIFNKLGKDSELNILEIGLGTNNPKLISTMGENGVPGASLYSFREYLPNSNIYGADVDKDILFESDRIKTCFVDQMDGKTYDEISKNFGNIKYDLIIDDGLHSIGANFNTLLFALDNLNTNGWLVIEDIGFGFIENWKSIDFVLSTNQNYERHIIKSASAYLYVIRKIE